MKNYRFYAILVPMTTIRLQELPSETAEAIKRALADGEDVFITGDKEERVAQLVSVRGKGHPLSDTPLREGGFAKGKIHLSDDWDSPATNDEIAREFGTLDG